MKKCRHCQSEIDKKAKVCPVCRKKQGSSLLKGLGIIIGIIIIIAGCSSLSKDLDKEDDNSCYATMEKFNKIETGMTYDEVVEIIGCDGELSTESSYEDTSMKIYGWYAKNGISNMTISFMNDKVDGKSQIGLD